jgi:hypothetical protein
LYSVTLKGKEVFFIVQGNVFAVNLPIIERYDIKGSYAGRHASKSELAKGKFAVLKDEDFVSRKRFLNVLNRIHLKKFQDILRKDVEWLKSAGLMDYSLLIAFIHVDDAGKHVISV